MCVDPSTILDGGAPNDVILDDGAANAQLPDTGRPEKQGLPDENPPVYYGTALTRFLIWIYNLRIDNPVDGICLLADNSPQPSVASFTTLTWRYCVQQFFRNFWSFRVA